MIEIAPDSERLTRIFYEAAAPAFFLGAVAGLIAILTSRSSEVMERLRRTEPAAVESDPVYLLRRAELLVSAIRFALAGGLCTTLLLALSFVSAFFQFQHIVGAGLLFLAATILIGLALFRFFQEVRVSLLELKQPGRSTAGTAPAERLLRQGLCGPSQPGAGRRPGEACREGPKEQPCGDRHR